MHAITSIHKVKTLFDEMAAYYVNKFDDIIINSILEQCNIQVDSIILEAGSGTSDFTPYLLKRTNDQGKIICNDISEKMLNIARKKMSDARVTFLAGDIASLSFASLKVDKVICFNMFPHIPDKLQFIRNVYSNLRKGSELILCHDRNRDLIMSMHRRHGIADAISHFPEIDDITSMMESSNFTINHVKDDEYFFMSAMKE